MKKLNSKARTTEVDDTSDRLLQLYAKETALKNESFLKPLFAEMQNLSDRITEAIRRDRALSDLEDADAMRDKAVTAIFKIVDGYAHIPVAAMSEPAERVQKILSNFGLAITRKNYATESSLIEAMLTDFRQTDIGADISELPGLEQAVTVLHDTQSDFTEKRVMYEKTKAAEKLGENAIMLKKPLVELINSKMVPYLEAMQLADPAKFSGIASGAAQVIADTNTAIEQRTKPKGSATTL